MTKDQMAAHLELLCEQLTTVRKDGQAEYARGEEAFGNFNRLAGKLGISRERVLLVYFEKHLDGIYSHVVDGHTSQRESVHGRIKDAMMYLALLDGMITENEVSVYTVDSLTEASRGNTRVLPISQEEV